MNSTELVGFVIGVWQDTRLPLEQRWQALCWLADRGWGKPVQAVEVDAEIRAEVAAMPLPNVDSLDADEARQLLALLDRVEGGRALLPGGDE